MNLSERIKNIRETKRIRQSEIANHLEIDQPNYARLEKRDVRLTYEQIQKISEALGVSVKELLFDEKEEKTDSNAIELLELKRQNKLLEIQLKYEKVSSELNNQKELVKRECYSYLEDFKLHLLQNIPMISYSPNIRNITESLISTVKNSRNKEDIETCQAILDATDSYAKEQKEREEDEDWVYENGHWFNSHTMEAVFESKTVKEYDDNSLFFRHFTVKPNDIFGKKYIKEIEEMILHSKFVTKRLLYYSFHPEYFHCFCFPLENHFFFWAIKSKLVDDEYLNKVYENCIEVADNLYNAKFQ